MRTDGWRAVARDAALPGALAFLALFAAQLAATLGIEVMGQRSEAVTEMVFEHYSEVLAGALALQLLAHLTVGAALGLLVRWVWRAVRPAAPARARWVFLGVVTLQLLVWARHVHHSPQAHAGLLYNAGGWRGALQVALTHGTPAWVLDAPLVVVAALAVLGLARVDWTRRRLGAALLLGVVALGSRAPARRWLHPNPGTPERPNVIVVANDSMRPDHLGLYGYDRPTSPNLDALAAESVVFERAYVPIARTFPSWASLLSGRPPHQHGLRHMFPQPERRLGGVPTVVRAFADAGYRTGVVADYAGDIFTRMDAGFERVVAPEFDVPALVRQRCLQMTPGLVPWLENPLGDWAFPDLRGLPDVPRTGRTIDELVAEVDREDGRPFFLVSFVSSSHFPFAAPAPWYRRFTLPDYRGASRYMRYQRLEEDPATLAAEERQVRGLFDGTLAWFDHHVGRLLGHLEGRGLLENTVVVITADHGESLGEAGTIGHGDHLRGAWTSRVPLIVRVPGGDPRRIPGIVRSVDLAPTLVAIAGLPPLPLEADSPWSGKDLGPLLRGERDDLGLLGYGETGLWFTERGEQFFQRDRMRYPGIVQLLAIRHEEGGDIVLRPTFEDRVAVAKSRAVWSRSAKLVYVPTPDGPRVERYEVDEAGRETPSTTPSPKLEAGLKALLEADGRAQVVGGYSLPQPPVSEP